MNCIKDPSYTLLEWAIQDLWCEFVEEVAHENRFFPKGDFMEYIQNLTSCKDVVHTGELFYRARLFSPNHYPELKIDNKPNEQKFTGLNGFSGAKSGSPPLGINSSGRANP